MKRDARDFVTLFNRFWYRDFPLSEAHKTSGTRAEWTTHIGICVRSSADLMGYFTHFEQGNRTDAVIKDNQGNDIAHIEWEWAQPYSEKVNEIRKLYDARKTGNFSVLISYSRHDCHDSNVRAIKRQWRKASEPLLVILATFEFRKGCETLISWRHTNSRTARYVKSEFNRRCHGVSKGVAGRP